MLAAKQGRGECVRMLVDAGADVNAMNKVSFLGGRRRRDVATCLSADAADFLWQDPIIMFFHLKYAFKPC